MEEIKTKAWDKLSERETHLIQQAKTKVVREIISEFEKEFLLLTVISPPLLEPVITVLRNVRSKWGINP